MSKHSAEDIKQAAEKIEELCERAREAYAEAKVVSDEFGVPFQVPHNTYIPEKYKELKGEFLRTAEEDQDAWIEAHGLNPDDIYYGEYNEGYAGWQSSYC